MSDEHGVEIQADRTAEPPVAPGSEGRGLFSFANTVSIGNCAAAFIALCYVSGYIIYAIYARTFGIYNIPVAKASFLEIGFIFLLLSVCFPVLPVAVLDVLSRMAKDKSVTERGLRRTGLAAFNLSVVLVLFAIFVTKSEWESKSAILQIPMHVIFLVYITTYTSCAIIGFEIEDRYDKLKQWIRTKTRYTGFGSQKLDSSIDAFAELARWILLISAIIMDIIIVVNMPWIYDLLSWAKYYLLILMITSYYLYRITKRSRTLSSVTARQYGLVGLIYVLVFYYLTLISYSYGLYPLIPTSRCGRFPIATSILTLKVGAAESCKPILGNLPNRTQYVWIMDETPNMLYVVLANDTFKPFELGNVYALRLHDIDGIETFPNSTPKIQHRKLLVPCNTHSFG